MKTVIMILMAMVMGTGALYGQTEYQAPPIPSDEQPEVLTRGPVNEAFAQPVNMDEESNFTVSKAPPPDIEEAPPEDRPDGDQFEWIPGYWAWDSERNEHIWVSGCWRAVPPGKYWVSGYWAEVEDGWRWVGGFWAPVSNENIEYLPAPPAVSYIAPPVTEAPDKIWVPACWYWYNNHYTMRSGYWIDAREDWVWVPSHYTWTPRGYVFVSGHWDYPLRNRGVLFAPVYFPGHTYWRSRYSYSLNIVVDIGNLEFGFFTRPRYSHYYFGDYYDSFYVGIGIFPRFECVSRYSWYDPIYLHDRWRNRRHYPNWWQHERHEYARRRADKNLRPPRTYRDMERRVKNMPESRRRIIEVAAPMKRHIEKNRTTLSFRKENPENRKQISRNTLESRRYANIRSNYESPTTVRKTLKNSQSKEYREDQKTIERKRTDREQSDQRVYSNIQRGDPNKTRVKDRESSTRSNHLEKRSTVSRQAKLREDSGNTTVRTSPVISEKKSGSTLKKKPSKSEGKKEEQKDQSDRKNSRGRAGSTKKSASRSLR